jgi:predicted ATPase
VDRVVAVDDMTAPPVTWQWSDVDATTTAARTQLTHRGGDAQLMVSAGRLVAGMGYAGASPATRRSLARVGALVRLRERGRYLVHAAGAVDPDGRGWLLAGDSGTGKSTLAYALSRAGWTILGDDGVLIERTVGGITAFAWRDALNVSGALASAFPELHEHSTRARTNDLRRRIPMSVPCARSARASALILVERAAEHAVTKLGPLEALGALVRQSPWVMIRDAHTRAHLDALRSTATLPAFRLRHTPAELHTIADVLGGLLS